MNTFLFVAEKPSVANRLAYFLSGEQRVNPTREHEHLVYRFMSQMQGRSINFVVTHCLGHITNYQFCGDRHLEPMEYFAARIEPVPTVLGKQFRAMLKELAPQVDRLILCLDNDREGEHISYEVVESFALFRRLSIFPAAMPRVRRVENSNVTADRLPMQAFRMRFNAINEYEVNRAFEQLQALDTRQIEAVDVRQELDLRIGFALSSLQMMNKRTLLGDLQDDEIKKTVLSFGTCETPTLGLLHYASEEDDRQKAHMSLKTANLTFQSESELMEVVQIQAAQIAETLDQKPYVTICGTSSSFAEAPPKPLNTVALQKKLSGQLPGRQIMRIAEDLYNSGAISYPRTETEIFEKGFEFDKIIANIKAGQAIPELEHYARELKPVYRTFTGKSDHSHPPIHPIKTPSAFKDSSYRLVFDTICRAFLACISPDCQKITHNYRILDFEDANFSTSKTFIVSPGWRSLYNEHADTIPQLSGEIIEKTELLDISEHGKHHEPTTERFLIDKMDSFGIGTDATISEHIEHVEDHKYVGKKNNSLCLTNAGLHLVKFYEKVNITAVATSFRAGMEAGLRSIENGRGDPNYIYKACLEFAMTLFKDAERCMRYKKLK